MKNLVIATFTAAEGKLPQLKSTLRERLKDTRAFDGCIRVQVYHERGTNTLTLVQDWESHEHYDRYSQWRREGNAEDLISLLEPGPEAFSSRKFASIAEV